MARLDNRDIEKIVTLAKAYGVTRLILFGSALENSAEARDIDLACDGGRGGNFMNWRRVSKMNCTRRSTLCR